jgi:transcriptional regulator with XRE-family HTH domain
LSVVNQLTQAAIGQRLGISGPRVSQILAGARAKMPPIDLGAIRQEALTMHMDVIRRAYEIAEMMAAPVTAGRFDDVLYDPETDEIVRDYSGRINALKLALAADKARRDLTGADEPSKQEMSGSVRYEVVSVDVTDLQ